MKTSHFLLALSLLSTSVIAKKKDNDAILLSKVKRLTVRDGHETTHRRVPALPQLSCVGGNAQGLYNVDVMRCENAGSEYGPEDISWTCKASLPPEFKLGSTDVICEGYDSPDDPFVLKGSCAVEYRLVLTPMGEKKYPERMGKAWKTSSSRKSSGPGSGGSDWPAAIIFWLIFGGIVCAILYSVIYGSPGGNNQPRNRNRQRFGGGGGWGGGDDGNDPPPPYTPRSPPRNSYTKSKASSSSSNRSQNSGPGFWTGAATGAAAGAAAGYIAGNRNQNRAQAGPSNWFGARGSSRTDTFGAGPSSYGGGSSEPSSSRYESTGFGGTSRR